MQPCVFIITGAMASGKSTIAMALAKRFKRSAYVEGDCFLRMMINGRATMGPVLDTEAQAQLRLRQELAMDAVTRLVESGFTVVYEDILIGSNLMSAVERLAAFAPHVIVLSPSSQVLAKRDQERSKTGYSVSFPPDILANALLCETPRIGTWIDNSEMSVDDVVEQIMAAHPTLANT